MRTMLKNLTHILLLFVLSLTAAAQDEVPEMSPAMYVVEADGTESEESGYDGSAPLKVIFRARPDHVGSYAARYEWRFTRAGEEQPFLTRFEEETTFDFVESGSFVVELLATFTLGTDTVQLTSGEPFLINISESKLEFPNAFTPNGDGTNDVFRAKEGYQSIVTFEATVFSRWGKKIYSWTDPAGGWDGKSGGSDVPDGAYYLVVKARGADGKQYNVKKVINILRGYTEDTGE